MTSRRFRLTDFPATIAAVLKTNDLRTLSGACFAFNGVQSVFIAYFVTYLVSLGYELTTAGFIFSLIVFLAMPCRVLWGWLGSFHVSPRVVMAGLSIGMAASIAMLGLSSEASSVTVVAAVGAVLSATALSWHGILLSEAARLAPAGTIATVTGGVLSFGQVGAFAGPLIFSLLLGLSGGYAAGWALCDSRVVDWPHAVAPDCGDPAERSRAVPVS